MTNKEFISQRINVYAGKNIDPNVDKEVEDMLRSKFNIYLPQRPSMNESLSAVNNDHEILQLLIQYRTMNP